MADIVLGKMSAFDFSNALHRSKDTDRKGDAREKVDLRPNASWAVSTPDLPIFLVAGNRAYAGREKVIAAFDIDKARQANKLLPPQWTAAIEGVPRGMIAGDDKLFVITDSSIQCFSQLGEAAVKHMITEGADVTATRDALLDAILKRDPNPNGYALVLGTTSADTLEQLVGQTNLHVITVDPATQNIDLLRRNKVIERRYGTRVAAIAKDFSNVELPPYFANIVTGDVAESADKSDLETLLTTSFHSLRPYGGFACWELTQQQHGAVAAILADGEFPNADLARDGSITFLTRAVHFPVRAAGRINTATQQTALCRRIRS